jgi:acetamidase/formamidase
MTFHRLEPAPDAAVDAFSAGHRPALTIDPGDTVEVRSLDAAGYLKRHRHRGDTGQPRMFPGPMAGHCLNRPIAVRGAAPGDMLAVQIAALTPGDWGCPAAPRSNAA